MPEYDAAGSWKGGMDEGGEAIMAAVPMHDDALKPVQPGKQALDCSCTEAGKKVIEDSISIDEICMGFLC